MNFLKSFLTGGLFFLLTIPLSAQSSSIQGVVLSEDDRTPIPNANITISTNQGTVSDEEGKFSISSLKPGTYTYSVSSIGYKEFTSQIELNEGESEELQILLESTVYGGDIAVVTATRTEKSLAEVSVPVTVIGEEEIRQSGSQRLGDILSEQIGMNIVSDHGTGIQIQGFDPDYTLILIDNQPVIGRTAGTLDLDRLSVGNIQQIEIVKGPSSALWGSDALAGVINIITDKGSKDFTLDASGQYGSNDSYSGSTNISFKQNRIKGNFFSDYLSSDGFDLDNSSVAPTIPAYDNLTLSGGIDYKLTKQFEIGIQGRYFSEDQNYQSEIVTQAESFLANGNDFQKDYSIAPEFSLNLGTKQLIEGSAFFSNFESSSELLYDATGDSYSLTTFDQTLNKYEIKSSSFWSNEHTTVFGTGMNREDLTSEIYADVSPFESYFVFGQHEWELTDKLYVAGGFRFDAHSEYRSQLSPKLSGRYKASDSFFIKASFGGGYKAPDFRQLFLDFTNPIAGYSVFGSSTLEEGLQNLQDNGEIDELFFDPASITEIEAEQSYSFNAGIELYPRKNLRFSINGFYNNVNDLIETERIALKTNGQSVFSYFNLNKIFTRGFETSFSYSPTFIKGLRLSGGYQYLDAQREITRTFDDVIDGEVVSLTVTKFVPMFNRSKHTWNAKAFYVYEPWDLEASARIQYRGEYGFADFNSNQLLDDSEYAESHSIINTSIGKTFFEKFTLMVGVNNLANYQSELYLPSNPGRTFYTQININLY